MKLTGPLGRVLVPLAVLLLYFLVPIAEDAPVGNLLGFGVAACAVATVGWVLTTEVRRAVRQLRLVHLLLAFELVLVAFSFGYYLLGVSQPEEFNGLHTRLDALYFSLTTMATVGYGDINAAGQLARAVVAVQLAFNLLFVGGLASLLQDQFRRNIRERAPVNGNQAVRPESGDDRTMSVEE